MMASEHATPGGNGLPDFGDPPVVEVVLSAGFQPLPRLRLVEIFKFWSTRIKQELPGVEEQGRYDMPLEQLGGGIQLPSVSWQVLPAPPMPRLWFLKAEGSHLLQIQNDWLARNWRRTGPLWDAWRDSIRVLIRVLADRDINRFADTAHCHRMASPAGAGAALTNIPIVGRRECGSANQSA